jgi:hypothetical protein
MRKLQIGLLCFAFIIYNLAFIIPVHAFDVMTTYKVPDTAAVNGDIISSTAAGLSRSTKSYDTHMFGVLVDDPLAVYRNTTPDKIDRPVATNSDEIVNVTDLNGAISTGDPITSSPIPGKGMKAIAGGFIAGIATGPEVVGQPITYLGKTYHTGQIPVSLRIGFYDSSQTTSAQTVFSSISSSFLKNAQDPEKFAVIMRYIITGIISILAFVVGLYAFTRSIAKGIEAIGRNPLAKKAIQFSIIIQVVLTLFVTFGAIVLAFLILRA